MLLLRVFFGPSGGSNTLDHSESLPCPSWCDHPDATNPYLDYVSVSDGLDRLPAYKTKRIWACQGSQSVLNKALFAKEIFVRVFGQAVSKQMVFKAVTKADVSHGPTETNTSC